MTKQESDRPAITGSFHELVRGRAGRDPPFAAALARASGMKEAPTLSLREALRDIWQADKYPILGNADWREAARVEAEALEGTTRAVMSPGDQPEFAAWIAA